MRLQRYIIIKNYKIDIILLGICIKVLITLLALGIWQLKRLEEKNSLLDKVKSTLYSPAKELSELDPKSIFYSKISLRGKFLEEESIYLYGRRSGMAEKDGYYLLTPFQSNDGNIIMVARGWFKHKNKEEIVKRDKGTSNFNNIEGIALPGEKAQFFMPPNDNANKIWFTLDLNEASNLLKEKVENFYLLMTTNPKIESLIPIATTNLLKIRNDHKEYAITWFSLAFALIVVFAFYTKRLN